MGYLESFECSEARQGGQILWCPLGFDTGPEGWYGGDVMEPTIEIFQRLNRPFSFAWETFPGFHDNHAKFDGRFNFWS